MSKKIEFIKYVETLIEATKNNPVEMNEDAHFYWESFRKTEEIEKPTFTENGKKIILWMREHPEIPIVKAREVAEGLVISSRAVSGAFRKLVSDGFVEKVGQDPVIYVLTDKGKNFEIVD